MDVKSGGIYLAFLGIVLVFVWLAWSGIYTDDEGTPAYLILSFGVVSVALTVWVSHGLGAVDDEGQPIAWGFSPIGYLAWLIKEIMAKVFGMKA